ncbi:hypothetical protein [Draconibacterium sediminis]|uniref:hypothetical protein n=1 Tax=Draconibacterium sediminis TaxID=1544798 RepID=UPI0026EAD639|nr:hypothetical protein [Draconibacterium sediminis]
MIRKTKNYWQLLTIPFNQKFKNVLLQQHLAAQFIALTGRYLIPQKPDGSNINMQYSSEKEMLLGNYHPDGWAVGIQLRNLAVLILDKNENTKTELPLEGLTFDKAFNEFKGALQSLEIDVSGLKIEQPYDIPTNGLSEGKFFNPGELATSENIHYRHNARLIINELAKLFNDVEPVRIWPHHFDTGTFATIARNEKGASSKTIGLGWAIPDSMVSEPYFYLSFWSENSLNTENVPEKLPAGKWMLPNWNGAVLSVSEIIQKESAEEQYSLLKEFFETGIESLLERMK